jgi:hypothetical protein
MVLPVNGAVFERAGHAPAATEVGYQVGGYVDDGQSFFSWTSCPGVDDITVGGCGPGPPAGHG